MAAAKIVPIAHEDLRPLGIPAKSIKLPLLGGGKAFVFAVPEAARRMMTADRLRAVAQSLGDMVHPARAVLVVMPEGTDIAVYTVETE